MDQLKDHDIQRPAWMVKSGVSITFSFSQYRASASNILQRDAIRNLPQSTVILKEEDYEDRSQIWAPTIVDDSCSTKPAQAKTCGRAMDNKKRLCPQNTQT